MADRFSAFRIIFVVSAAAFVCGCASVRISKKKELRPQSDFWVQYVEYTPKRDAIKRGVIIVPPTGGVNFIDRSYAKDMARHGATVKVLSDWKKPSRHINLSLHQEHNLSAVKAITALADSFPKDNEISLLGTSEGAMYAQLAAIHADRVQTILVIAGGAPIREVIGTSEYETMTNLKKERVKKFGYKSDQEYMAALKAAFPLDDNFSKISATKRLGVIYFSEDKDVPTKTQLQLLEMWRPKYKRELESSHMTGILKTWLYYDDEIRNFLIKE